MSRYTWSCANCWVAFLQPLKRIDDVAWEQSRPSGEGSRTNPLKFKQMLKRPVQDFFGGKAGKKPIFTTSIAHCQCSLLATLSLRALSPRSSVDKPSSISKNDYITSSDKLLIGSEPTTCCIWKQLWNMAFSTNTIQIRANRWPASFMSFRRITEIPLSALFIGHKLLQKKV